MVPSPYNFHSWSSPRNKLPGICLMEKVEVMHWLPWSLLIKLSERLQKVIVLLKQQINLTMLGDALRNDGFD